MSGSEPAQFGEVVSWVATVDANAKASEQFIGYLMNEGYKDWIGFAPEGKIPTRKGSKDDPTAYIDAWAKLPAGVDKKAPRLLSRLTDSTCFLPSVTVSGSRRLRIPISPSARFCVSRSMANPRPATPTSARPARPPFL